MFFDRLNGKFQMRVIQQALSILLSILTVSFAADTPHELSKIAGWKGAAPNSENTFNFIILSDRTGGHVPGRWAQAIEQINLLKPDFVMSVGDFIEGYTEDVNRLNAEWAEFDEITQKLDAPFFYCPGNHDVLNPKMLKLYIEKHGVNGKSYYSFDYKGSHFVILDSSSAMRDTDFADAQIKWLARDMNSYSKADRIFVFYHHPEMKNKPCFKKTMELLPKDKTTIFAGHRHELNYLEHNSLPIHVLAETGSAKRKVDPNIGIVPGFAHVTVDHGRESISFIRLGEIYSVDSFRDMTLAKKLYNKVPVYPMVFDSNEYLIKIKNQSTISADYEVIDLVNGQK